MEALFAVAIVCLSAFGLAVGLLLGRKPLARSGDSLTCIGGARCAGCPNSEDRT